MRKIMFALMLIALTISSIAFAGSEETQKEEANCPTTANCASCPCK